MPDLLTWPPIPRKILRASLFVAYAAALIVGLDVIDHRGTVPGAHIGEPFVTAVGYICTIGGLTAGAGVLLRRWRLEFIAIAAIGGGLFLYNLIDWWVVLFVRQELPLRGPAIVTFSLALLVARGAYLHAFSRRTTAVKRRTRAELRT